MLVPPFLPFALCPYAVDFLATAWAVATVRYVISTYNQFTYDRPWWAGISFTFSILELNTGLICACVPTFSPLLSVFSSCRVSNYVSSWTTRASGVWHNSTEKTPWDDFEYHGHLTAELRETQDREELGSRRDSRGTHISDSKDLATFSPVYKPSLSVGKYIDL
ncbi:hypothetical protein ONZ43_g6541 [Nemania bipapillata]|uniref:Uncharacterized protein n=1 Tax=Nemania bipapillata TaxID=110536 RepID=A0ACC2HYU3_9PEZI|nr:hypothetical protein ONZ43_g6541 [Nemania bipapillata]